MSVSGITSSELTAEEQRHVRCDLLERANSPIWFYDFDKYAIAWANTAALNIWDSPSVAELAARDLQLDMSSAVNERLQQIREDLEDVLDISSTELRAVSLEMAPFDIGALVHSVAEGLSTPANQKGLDLKLKVCPNLPLTAYGDQRRLAQVIRNLVGNAIKYTKAGFIQISIQQTGYAMQVQVSDTGIGIPEEQKSRIFERFYQPREIDYATNDGVGLGLSIVKEIIDLWGGQLTVADAEEGGACFTFTLPDAFVCSRTKLVEAEKAHMR